MVEMNPTPVLGTFTSLKNVALLYVTPDVLSLWQQHSKIFMIRHFPRMTTPMTDNLLLLTDSYKTSHYLQYPPGTTKVYSYFESRGGKFPNVVFFGLQYVLKRWMTGKVVTAEKIEQAKEIIGEHMGDKNLFNADGWKYILDKHDGYLPIEVKAVPEGSIIPTRNVLFTVENTDPACYWLTSYLETLFVQAWYPVTVCTNSWAQKGIISKYLTETADDLNGLLFKLHDFGFRGTTSVESAGIAGCAHLVNFRGTDTIAAVLVARDYYGCKMAGFSIPAAEHSSITSWTRDGELDAYKNMLEKFPNGTVAVVSDSFDVFSACRDMWGGSLKAKVLERGKKGGVLVVRPDSGDPAETVCKVLDILGERFGTSVNKKGFKMLPPYLRVIQGDGISYESLQDILEAMKKAKWSAENLAFGSGGALLQRLHRDTQKIAFKCSLIERDGKEINVYKDPITDHGKISKKGRMTLQKVNGEIVTMQEGKGNPEEDMMVTVFKNGKLTREYTFDDIRKRVDSQPCHQALINSQNAK